MAWYALCVRLYHAGKGKGGSGQKGGGKPGPRAAKDEVSRQGRRAESGEGRQGARGCP